MYPVIKQLLCKNALSGCTYIEPFAGGAGLALKLLIRGDVDRIVINDFDPGIYSFWLSAVRFPNELCELIERTPVTMDEWKRQKDIHAKSDTSRCVELAFATLFLNRTNIGGIIKGGVIGGLEQSGKYKLDARYTKSTLINKIMRIYELRERIDVTFMDAKEMLINGYLDQYKQPFLNIDPPYVVKGGGLYKSFFNTEDHAELARVVTDLNFPWVVTYDMNELVKTLYGSFRMEPISLRYSISKNVQSNEYMFFSSDLIGVDHD